MRLCGEPRTMVRARLLAVCALAWPALAACSNDELPPAPLETRPLESFVTGEVAQQIDPNNQFIFSAAVSAEEIPEHQARALAHVFARDFLPMVRSRLERSRGAAIDFTALRPCGRGHRAYSSFDLSSLAMPRSAEMYESFRRSIGDHWLVSLCSPDGQMTLVVAVSVYARNLRIVNDRLAWPDDGSIQGAEFVPTAIPMKLGGLPFSPEGVVEEISRRFGTRIAALPELVIPVPPRGTPALASWRIVLDRDVRLEANQPPVRQLYVTPNLRATGSDAGSIAVADLSSPSILPVQVPLRFADSMSVTYSISVRPGIPVQLRQTGATIRALP